jgi:NADPH:quinone reductase-like Zn-dependent oxidoreductase
MKAVVYERYGPPDVLELREVERPPVPDDGVLVRVRAASLNRFEWYAVRGAPWIGRPSMGLRRPKTNRLGVDFAGTVEAVGKDVTGFRPGDDVFGGRTGALAEYVCVPEDRAIVAKPADVPFDQAACVGMAALTALQGLRDKGRITAGQRVLVNGASGGVGTFAVQLAKAFGAEVTAVCSTRNVEQARALGADHVVDYTREDFTRGDRRYDLMLDVAGSRSWRECRRVLAADATVVMAGAPKGGTVLGPLGHIVAFRVAALGSGRKVAFYVASFARPDLETLRELLATGKLTPVVERTYPLDEIADALRYVGQGHARGKIVVTP